MTGWTRTAPSASVRLEAESRELAAALGRQAEVIDLLVLVPTEPGLVRAKLRAAADDALPLLLALSECDLDLVRGEEVVRAAQAGLTATLSRGGAGADVVPSLLTAAEAFTVLAARLAEVLEKYPDAPETLFQALGTGWTVDELAQLPGRLGAIARSLGDASAAQGEMAGPGADLVQRKAALVQAAQAYGEAFGSIGGTIVPPIGDHLCEAAARLMSTGISTPGWNGLRQDAAFIAGDFAATLPRARVLDAIADVGDRRAPRALGDLSAVFGFIFAGWAYVLDRAVELAQLMPVPSDGTDGPAMIEVVTELRRRVDADNGQLRSACAALAQLGAEPQREYEDAVRAGLGMDVERARGHGDRFRPFAVPMPSLRARPSSDKGGGPSPSLSGTRLSLEREFESVGDFVLAMVQGGADEATVRRVGSVDVIETLQLGCNTVVHVQRAENVIEVAIGFGSDEELAEHNRLALDVPDGSELEFVQFGALVAIRGAWTGYEDTFAWEVAGSVAGAGARGRIRVTRGASGAVRVIESVGQLDQAAFSAALGMSTGKRIRFS
jgi:hypothetical protein